MFVKRRKALGNKRNDISAEDIAEITKIYGDFKESEISQIYDNKDFGYTKITVERPLRDEEGNLVLKKEKTAGYQPSRYRKCSTERGY